MEVSGPLFEAFPLPGETLNDALCCYHHLPALHGEWGDNTV